VITAVCSLYSIPAALTPSPVILFQQLQGSLNPFIVSARRIDIVSHVLAVGTCSRSASEARRIPSLNILRTYEATAVSVGAVGPVSRIPLYLLLQKVTEYLRIQERPALFDWYRLAASRWVARFIVRCSSVYFIQTFTAKMMCASERRHVTPGEVIHADTASQPRCVV
jgi:hypothetical protein